MPADYIITRLRGGFALAYWPNGKRRRYSLGTSDPREAERRAPAVYAELTKPKGKTVAIIWDAYATDMARCIRHKM